MEAILFFVLNNQVPVWGLEVFITIAVASGQRTS